MAGYPVMLSTKVAAVWVVYTRRICLVGAMVTHQMHVLLVWLELTDEADLDNPRQRCPTGLRDHRLQAAS
jgi:hypothetical protein